ncbi:hypothetical protein HanXRQr2_Chr15g0708631 [Helianthus annuus]|uniref:Uncharacterized protein n=1 Tax=Helianthus annuus TaxID=4232 RepID=A0A9K3E4D7_HELAN|nr:hypothetical protein HanXRQr2_Chr15g0708631 [Helianthus annuus]KAJ0832566.1 hypothetical protein HanPSC8_Chr15g0680201 [Helianthus annuus]
MIHLSVVLNLWPTTLTFIVAQESRVEINMLGGEQILSSTIPATSPLPLASHLLCLNRVEHLCSI